uniref:Annexin n=1 Tax=Pseudictyota dubia TaxID=2749911 RepID=A0A7R9ZIL9_9STRA|mmetsp:Transcript_8480/g.15525  ORF Transcript_8480/g.15525 Transcript_8480/m.15525 type:complete len:122 (+) Transcript_8480:701-1066(+)
MEVNKQYAEEYGYTMSKAIEKELSGDAKDAALYLLGMKLNPGKTVAKLVKKACEGIGTDELLLTSTLIRYQRMLPEANDAFGRMYAETIQDCVSKEQGGNLGRLYARLLSICEEKTADPSE